MRPRWTGVGFLASCLIFAAYWIASSPLADQPRYGVYSRRFIAFVDSIPIHDPDPYPFLGSAAAALGVFHVLNPPVLITTMGSDRYTASETPFWRSDWRFSLQALLTSAWWWWLLGRLVEHRGSARATLLHVAFAIPLLCFLVVLSLYRSLWIRTPHGLGGFSNVALVISAATLLFAVGWARHAGLLRLRPAYILIGVVILLSLLVWPPLVLDEWRLGEPHHYRFFGYSGFWRRLEPARSAHSDVPFHFNLRVALNLLAAEVLVVVASGVALLEPRQASAAPAV